LVSDPPLPWSLIVLRVRILLLFLELVF